MIRAFCFTLVMAAGPALSADQDVTFPGGSDGVTLAGALRLPDGGPHPAVVILSGSGPQDRNGTFRSLQPFAHIAATFELAGIATLRFDDRGIGKSTGDPNVLMEADAADAGAALRWLCQQPGIDARRVGFLGHSSGAVAATSAVADGAPAAFAAMLAGPGLPGDEVMRTQFAARMESVGQPPEKIAQNKAFVDRMISATLKGDEALRTEVDAIAAEAGANKAWKDANIALFSTPWFRQFLRLDPAPGLAGLTIPTLALFGGADVQVHGESNAAAARVALAGNPGAKVMILPKHDHRFQVVPHGRFGSPIGPAPSEETLDLLINWITAVPPRESPCNKSSE